MPSKSSPQAYEVAQQAKRQERITIKRDDRNNDWIIELGPGLDLLEVIHIVGVVQLQAIGLMQQQILDALAPKDSPKKCDDQSLRDTVEF